MERKTRIRRLRSWHIFICCFFCLVLLGAVALSQESKLKDIEEERVALMEDYEKLLLEEQRLERMLEYANTDEYIEQFARERLGYVWPEDYKFFKE